MAGHPEPRPSTGGGQPQETQVDDPEQARKAHEAADAREAKATNRERMVDIGRAEDQAGRRGQ
jgi:hypothetical protein